MPYEDFIRLGGRTDTPLRGSATRRFAIENSGCPDCGTEISPLHFCAECGRDHSDELRRLNRNFGEN